ncbi:methyl-accepting chemotaxis sensory transducer [Paraglaciecola psychrophila 170]|uniref:Methyl-accepting chemotaxis sensory transducer n=1 Tax=Paraglaciecola psychrophila 170 TaxID=1129794 RepID=M4RUW6_9ALTE|nr:methyl-accepting chemotaxis sensory transducer [Paraglaciecola psychrophila 170]
MNFLTKMSITQKLFLIPIIETVGFLIHLGITTSIALKNVGLLENVIRSAISRFRCHQKCIDQNGKHQEHSNLLNKFRKP